MFPQITGEEIPLYEDGRHDPNVVDVWADVSYPLPLRNDIHFILHAAGVASPVYYMKYPLETIESAVQGNPDVNLIVTADDRSPLSR